MEEHAAGQLCLCPCGARVSWGHKEGLHWPLGTQDFLSSQVDCDACLDVSRKCVTISHVPGLLRASVTSLLPLVLEKACPKQTDTSPQAAQLVLRQTRGPG